MLICLQFRPERLWIPLHEAEHRVVPLFLMFVSVMAPKTVASWATHLIFMKAIAVELKALGLLAVAGYFFPALTFFDFNALLFDLFKHFSNFYFLPRLLYHLRLKLLSDLLYLVGRNPRIIILLIIFGG